MKNQRGNFRLCMMCFPSEKVYFCFLAGINVGYFTLIHSENELMKDRFQVCENTIPVCPNF